MMRRSLSVSTIFTAGYFVGAGIATWEFANSILLSAGLVVAGVVLALVGFHFGPTDEEIARHEMAQEVLWDDE